jgi:hypothetical protein
VETVERTAQDLGVDYRGIQEAVEGPGWFVFNEPLTGSSFLVPRDVKNLKAGILSGVERKRREYGIWIDRISADQGDMAAEARLLHKERTGWA